MHYDPFFILPGKKGEKSIVAASLSRDIKNIGKTTDTILMSKFSPGKNTEVGAHLTFGFLNNSAKSFSTLSVGGKYRLGENRAATLTLALPAKDVKDPGISLGFMNTSIINTGFQINQMVLLGGLKGYTSKNSTLVFNVILEPVLSITSRWAVVPKITAASDTENVSNHLAIDLNPTIDWLVADGNLINIGCSFGLAGSNKANTTSISIGLLRSM
tara:strand:- start:7982 stop:8626 length:645 start_codon:yes stop_codon:yes gene_type:complete